MELELSYNAATDIPKGFEALYTEQGGKFVLTGVKGLSTIQASVSRLETSLNAERTAHKATKAKITELETNLATVTTERDEFQVAAEGKGGKIDEAKLNELADKRAALKINPIQRELDAARSKIAETEGKLNEALGRERATTVRSSLQAAAAKAGVVPEMQEVAVRLLALDMDVDESGAVRAKEGAAMVAPGLDPLAAFNDMKGKYPNFWAASQGGGAKGGGAMGNQGDMKCWTKAGWNMTEQFRQMQEKGEDYARKMAQSAGVDFDNPKPPEK